MKTSGIRSYNCKDEELPVICRYALPYLKRDLADFATFSPVFNDDYVEKFTAKINLVDELVLPNIEINELKKITKRLYLTMDSVLDPCRQNSRLSSLGEKYGRCIGKGICI
jgi:hypothetical protein